jgi:hypothetical protein
MKIIRWIGWASTAIAVVILIFAVIAFLTGKSILHVAHGTSYFIAASSFLLLAIAIFIATKQCCCDKCECKDEKQEP